MQTPKLFEQITSGISNPDIIRQWLSAFAPSGEKGKELFAQPPTAWLSGVQLMLRGSDALRQMQLDAIHDTQKRTSRLSDSLAHATNPADAGKAWQQFSQDNLQNTIAYWTACREILQDTELKLVKTAENPISKVAIDVKPEARSVKSAKRKPAAKSRARRTASS